MKQVTVGKKARNELLDVIKGIAIILVVLGHSIQYGSGVDFSNSAAFFNDALFKIIYSFHMPLFMLISGYFFYFSTLKYLSWRAFLANRIVKIIIPIFTWNILTLSVYMILQINGVNSYNLMDILFFIFTNLWFLWAIFWCSLIVMLTKKAFHDSLCIYLLVFILAFFVTDDYGLAGYKSMYLFFILGYLYNKNSIKINPQIIKFQPTYLLIFVAMIYCISMFAYDHDSYIYTSGHTIIGKNVLVQIYVDLYRYFIGLIGSVFVILGVNYFLKNNYFKKTVLLPKFGSNSFGIYVISTSFLPILSLITKSFSLNYFVNLSETILIIAVSCLIIKFFKQHNLTNIIFLGGR